MVATGSQPSVSSFVSRHRTGVVLVVLLALGSVMVGLTHRPATAKPEQIGRRIFAALQSTLNDVGNSSMAPGTPSRNCAACVWS